MRKLWRPEVHLSAVLILGALALSGCGADVVPREQQPTIGATPVGPDPSANMETEPPVEPERPAPCPSMPTPTPSPNPDPDGVASATACGEEAAPLTREEMMNAIPMPMPGVPGPPAPSIGTPGVVPGLENPGHWVPDSMSSAKPAPMPDGG